MDIDVIISSKKEMTLREAPQLIHRHQVYYNFSVQEHVTHAHPFPYIHCICGCLNQEVASKIVTFPSPTLYSMFMAPSKILFTRYWDCL